MDTKEAIGFLNHLTKDQVPFFGLNDLRIWTRDRETPDALRKSIRRHCALGLFRRIYKDIYVNGLNDPFRQDIFLAYKLANMLRPGENNWESLESRLSQLGVISQVPNRLTFMTTGRSGVMTTAVGTFEFSHSPRGRLPDIRYYADTGILHATARQAWEDLRFVGRNTWMVDMERLEEEIADEKAA